MVSVVIADWIERRQEEFDRLCTGTPGISRLLDPFVVCGVSFSLLDIHWNNNSVTMPGNLQDILHHHDFVEIHIPFRGAGVVADQNQSRVYRKGSFTLNSPHSPHARFVKEAPSEILLFWLLVECVNTPDATAKMIEQAFNHQQNMVFQLDDSALHLIDQLFSVFLTPSPFRREHLNLVFRSLIMDIIHALLKDQWSDIHIEITPIINQTDYLFRSRVDEFIQSNLEKIDSLELIARHFNLCEKTLTRRYLKDKGRTIWDTVMAMRMDRAKILLASSPLSIETIAMRCGYKNTGYFARCFKAHFGQTPRQVRKK